MDIRKVAAQATSIVVQAGWKAPRKPREVKRLSRISRALESLNQELVQTNGFHGLQSIQLHAYKVKKASSYMVIFDVHYARSTDRYTLVCDEADTFSLCKKKAGKK